MPSAEPDSETRIEFINIDIGEAEIAAVVDVLKSRQLSHGAVVEELEREFAAYVGSSDAVGVTNGTVSLTGTLIALGIGPGDEVIVPALTFIATPNSALHAGARPVFADIDPDTYTLDPESVAAAVTDRTRAVIPVHLYGHPADMEALESLARKRGLALIEDCAQAHGAEYRGVRVGSRNPGSFSFYATKNMAAGEGGIVTFNDPEPAQILRELRLHGALERDRYIRLGYNWKMTNLTAAMARLQLEKLDGFNAARRHAARLYGELLADVEELKLPVERPGCKSVFHLYTVQTPPGRRQEFRRALERRGVPTGVYYPTPCHKQPVYLERGWAGAALPVAESVCERIVSLPVHGAMIEEHVRFVADTIKATAKEWN